MKQQKFDVMANDETPSLFATLTVLLMAGISVLVCGTGCQMSGVRQLSRASSDARPALAVTPDPQAAPSSDGTPADAEVQTVAFHQSQPENPEAPAPIEPPNPVVTASDVILAESSLAARRVFLSDQVVTSSDVRHSENAMSESAEVIDGELSEANSDYPIDLLTAMRLAGANHLQIALATERIQEACARLEQAEFMWVPNLNLGIGYNRHDGPIQDTTGNVIDVSRQSLYFGGGAGVGDSPLSGGASGPARLFVDLSTADVFFCPTGSSSECGRHATCPSRRRE